MKKLLLVLFLVASGSAAYVRPSVATNPTTQIESAPRNRINPEASPTQVQGAGVVSRILPDDNDGSRHQRFILRLQSGQTILVAHNIDIAPRVDRLKRVTLWSTAENINGMQKAVSCIGLTTIHLVSTLRDG